MPLWKPNDRTDLHLWLKPEDIPSTGSMSVWKDSSKNAFPVIQGTSADQPTVSTTLKNNKRMIDWGDSSDHNHFTIAKDADGAGASTFNLPMDVAADEEFYLGFFVKVTAGSGSQVLFSHDTSSSKSELRINADEKVVFGGRSDSGASTVIGHADNAMSDGDFKWIGARRHSNDTVALFVNDTEDTTDSDSSTSGGTLQEDSPVNIGVRKVEGGTASLGWQGLISEVCCFHGDPGATDIPKIEGYIAHKYGINSDLTDTTYKSGPPTACHCVASGTLSTTNLSSNPKNPAELSENLNIFDERR
tara:strand:+ start:558 stop:1466 length:909 start_codon:yes stop_codon:yes gene_type:complete